MRNSQILVVNDFKGYLRAFPRLTHDMITYGNNGLTHDAQGNHMGKKFGFTCQMNQPNADGSARVYDSSGSFLIGELERLDQTMHPPLAAVSYGRDLDLREDATIADEVTSFTTSTYGSPGGLGTGSSVGTGKAWMGKNTTQIANVGLDIGKTAQPFRPWALELSYDILELESAARLGRPIDVQKYDGLQLKYQMDVDEQAYYGDTATGDKGLINNASVTATNVVASTITGSTLWSQKNSDEILNDINTAIISVWTTAAVAVMPDSLLIPPAQYGQLAMQKVSQAGNVSVLEYVRENNIVKKSGQNLRIDPLKWAIGAAVGGTILTLGTGDRMIVYRKEYDKVRFPLTSLQRTPVQYDGMYHKTSYYGRLGVVEVIYPQLIGYFDGI